MCQKNVIDSIEQRATAVSGCSSYGAVDISDFNTLLRLARLAEQAEASWTRREKDGTMFTTEETRSIQMKIRAILHPAPKGEVYWRESGSNDFRNVHGCNDLLTLDEAKRRMGA